MVGQTTLDLGVVGKKIDLLFGDRQADAIAVGRPLLLQTQSREFSSLQDTVPALATPVCTENSSSTVVVMKSAQDAK
jgi:hypothetical protein